jgi:molybdenum cofactor cytidylyltransferase
LSNEGNKTVGVILAAGASTRFGSPKQLAKIGHQTLLAKAQSNLLECRLNANGVVLGSHAAELKAFLLDGIEVIHNKEWASGLASSVQKATAFATARKATHLLIAVCDQPLVTAELLNQLLQRSAESPQSIIACGYGDSPGVPAIFPARCFGKLARLEGDRGAKAIIMAENDREIVAFPQGEIDIDKPSDLWPFKIESATTTDGAAIARVFRSTYVDTLPDFPVLHSPTEDRDYFTALIENENVFVARNLSEEIIAFISFDDQWINQLWVLPEYKGQRLGKSLLQIARAGRDTFKLWTFQINSGAREFYKRNGFVEVLQTDGAENEERQPDVLLSWSKNS